jgi:chromosome segregation ATPase
MKKTNYVVAIAILVAGAMWSGCDSVAKRKVAAKEDLLTARENLKQAKLEVQKVVNEEEWDAFKQASEVKIRDNETRIDSLKVKLVKPGQLLDPIYEKRIETLRQKNVDLRAEIGRYEANMSDWEKFKREFNNKIDELALAIKNITSDNKN